MPFLITFLSALLVRDGTDEPAVPRHGLAGDGVLDEVDALLQRDGGVPARVPDVPAQLDVGQDAVVAVDFVHGVQEGLDALDAVVLPDLAAHSGVGRLNGRVVVNGEQRSQDDVPFLASHSPLGGVRGGLWGRDGST